ncbi:MAG: hypothetical protein RBT61_03850, partial [Candidatus Kapabacteria bacterium]|nr:hypothetical protein [Candidatus Kapabacteria bacterium]
TINSLDAESAGLHLHLTVNDDGNNKYDVEGIQSFLNINGGVADTYYTGNWSVAESDNGIATGVWGDAYAANAQTNLGVVGSAFGAATANVGVFGAANDFDYEGYTLGLPAGFGAGVVAYNNNGSFSDYGLFAQAPGNATGVYSSAAEGSAYIGINESTVEPTIFAYNMEAGPSLIALSDVPSGSTSASIENFGGGRGAHIWGGAANDKDGGNPYLLDPMDQDDAALVVYNLESMMGAPWATAIKTYGDIWANSAIGASQIIGLDRVVVGDPINGPFIELLPPAAPGDPLVIDGDVLINGDLEVDKVVADEIEVTDLIGENGVFENLTVNIEANINTANIATANIAEVNAMVANLDEANVMVANIDEANITTANITDAMVDHADVALAHIEEAVIETSIELGMNTELIADMSGIQGAGNAGDLLVSKGAGLNPEWTNTLPALNIFDLNVLNNANIGNDLLVGGNSEVVGSALVGADLEVMGNGLVNLDFAVLGNILGGSNVEIVGDLDVWGHTTVTNFTSLGLSTLEGLQVNNNANFDGAVNVNGATTLTTLNTSGLASLNSAVVSGTLDVTGNTTLTTLTTSGLATLNDADVVNNATIGGDLTVTGVATMDGNANFNGSNVNLANTTLLQMDGNAGNAGELLVSNGLAGAPSWTNSIPQLTVTGTLTTNDLQVDNNAIINNDLDVLGNGFFQNDLDVSANLFAQDAVIGNDILVANDVMVGNNLDVVADAAIFGNAEVFGDLDVIGNIEAIGDVTGENLNANTDVVAGNDVVALNNVEAVNNIEALTGDVIAANNVEAGNDVNATNNVNATNVNATNNMTAQNDVIAINTLRGEFGVINQDLTVGDNVTAGSMNATVATVATLNASDATISNNLTVNNNIVLNGTISNAFGPLVIDDQFQVNETSVFNDDVTVNGDITANTLNILDLNAANAHFTGTLEVDGITTLNNDLNVSGTTNIADLNAANGTFTGTVIATGFTGDLTGNVNGGTVNGTSGTFTGNLTAAGFTGDLTGNVNGGTVNGTSGTFTGNLTAAGFTGDLTGNVNGGTFTGTTGTFSGAVTAPTFTGDLTGNVTGGTISGTTGTFSGAVSASDVSATGNISGANITTTDGAAVNSFAGNVEMANTLTVNGNANFANPVNINNTLTVANTLFADGQLAHMAIEVDETNVNWSNAALGGRYSFYVYIGNGALQVNTNPELPNTGTIMYIANEGTGNLTLDLDGDTVYETLIAPGEVMQFISTGFEIRRVL